MALIRCPECGGQVSDKAAACIHCGCPLNISREKTFKIIFVNFTTSSPKLQSRIIDGFSKFIYIDNETEQKLKNKEIPCVLHDGITKDNVECIQKLISLWECIVDIQESDSEPNIEVNQKLTDDRTGKVVRCPKCRSTAISTGQRGFKITTGFIGSNKTVNRCSNCGYTWEP